MKKKCEVEGCGRDHKALGLCSRHYWRLKRGGNPHTPSRKEMSLEGRFRAKLGSKDPVTGCIEWTGTRHKDGYGMIKCGERMVGAHRLAWELKHGPIPEGQCALHECDNPPCCNDEHLFLGTKADNAADREAKGRGGRSKLTEVDVIEIRRRLVAGESQRVVAAVFGVTRAQVSRIKNRQTWKRI